MRIVLTDKLLVYIICIGFISCTSEVKRKEPAIIRDSSTAVITASPQVEIKIDSSLIVIDTATKLCWMKKDFSIIKGRFLDSWEEIFDWQKELNAVNYAGFNDWRVPTVKEYRTINKNPADRKIYRQKFEQMDSSFVWGKGPYAFWSSTTPNENVAGYISFIDGFATSGSRKVEYASEYSDWKGARFEMSVRLVRTIE